MVIKVKETDTHVYFLTGPYSQWYTSWFKQSLHPDSDLLEFHCGEQYMMAGKAFLFEDYDVLEKIMQVEQNPYNPNEAPDKIKKLGREVKGFNDAVWLENCDDIVFRGNWAKFTQNRHLTSYMMDSVGKMLVEGASYDRVWGVGLAWNDPKILDEKNWRGDNRLGKAIMRVRSNYEALLAALATNPNAQFDVWTQKII